jgi:hypothetical protein
MKGSLLTLLVFTAACSHPPTSRGGKSLLDLSVHVQDMNDWGEFISPMSGCKEGAPTRHYFLSLDGGRPVSIDIPCNESEPRIYDVIAVKAHLGAHRIVVSDANMRKICARQIQAGRSSIRSEAILVQVTGETCSIEDPVEAPIAVY